MIISKFFNLIELTDFYWLHFLTWKNAYAFEGISRFNLKEDIINVAYYEILINCENYTDSSTKCTKFCIVYLIKFICLAFDWTFWLHSHTCKGTRINNQSNFRHCWALAFSRIVKYETTKEKKEAFLSAAQKRRSSLAKKIIEILYDRN